MGHQEGMRICFMRKNNRFIPYGFYIVVYEDNHYESLIMCKPFDSMFYWVGNDLLEILYEHLSIDKENGEVWIWIPFTISMSR